MTIKGRGAIFIGTLLASSFCMAAPDIELTDDTSFANDSIQSPHDANQGMVTSINDNNLPNNVGAHPSLNATSPPSEMPPTPNDDLSADTATGDDDY